MSSSDTGRLHWFRIWWGIGWCWVALVWYLSLTAKPPLPDLDIAFADKYGHLLAYAWLMGWFGNVYQCSHARIIYAVVFVLMGVGLEFLQGIGAARLFEYADMLANTLGVVLGYLLVRGQLGQLLYSIEKRLKRQSA